MLWKRGVLVIAAVAWMRSDALARGKHLNGSRGDPHINFGAGKLIWNAVVMVVHLDVIIRRDATDAPFSKDIWF